jgi:hypothetical protein
VVEVAKALQLPRQPHPQEEEHRLNQGAVVTPEAIAEEDSEIQNLTMHIIITIRHE